jgi:hypothetical protein
MRIDIVNRRGAALCAAGLDAGLDADLPLGLSGCGGLLALVLGRSCGVAARALSLKGVYGWQTQRQ